MKQGSQTNKLFRTIVALAATVGVSMNGLPAHLRLVDRNGDSSNTLRRQFSRGKASKKKRGKK